MPRNPSRRRVRTALALSAAVLGLLLMAPGAWAYTCGTTLDDFDRADSSNLGTKWTEQAPDFAITGGRATNAGATAGLMTFNNFAASEVCVDVATNGTTLQYAGVALRYGSLTKNLFIKVQQLNSGTGFAKAYFYVGNNGAAGATPTSVDLTPFTSARLHVFVVGNRVTLDVDTNFDGAPEASFASDYPATLTGLGTGVGLASYGGARLDNFRRPTPGSNPTPGTPKGGSGGDDSTAKPKLGSLGLSRSAFKAAGSGPATSAAKVGTKVRFSLSEKASVRFTVQRKSTGRRVGGKCAKQRPSNRGKRSCTRWVTVSGAFKKSGKTGKNSFTFRGRIGGKALSAGRYRFGARAVDTDKNKSALRRKGFKIVS
jgi:hypothetical protein